MLKKGIGLLLLLALAVWGGAWSRLFVVAVLLVGLPAELYLTRKSRELVE